MAVQPLGTAHAGLEAARFLRLLTQICYSSAELGTTVRRVHLLLPSPDELARYEGAAAGPGREAPPPGLRPHAMSIASP